jgi:hydroxymethylpyrimidine/phosphomethylpyrimidine kinase
MTYKCLSIAGFDGSGGAGIQADLKTFSALSCYGMNVLTAIPVQNTQGVRSCYELPLSCVEEQLQAIFDDVRPDAIKIGMLFTAPIIELVAEFLSFHATDIPIVLDPVMVAKSGDYLLKADAVEILKKKLFPICDLVTPNLPEAYALVGHQEGLEKIGEDLLKLGVKAVLVKGGHDQSLSCDDLLFLPGGRCKHFHSERINSKNTHGTGCTLSAAIAALLAQGFSLEGACEVAKDYLFNAIKASKNSSIGLGHGPVHHFFHLWPTSYSKEHIHLDFSHLGC